ncbi:MAG: Oxidoreductase, FAD-binding protein [Myxococcaceae bacterium]|nr:Oxidoreductase, FAD-binding protein [Myxococcaceae bacterium]
MTNVDSPALSSLLRRIEQDFPADFLSTDPSDLSEYGRDWTRVFQPAPCAVALPRSTEEVARLLALCHEAGIAVVPSGGRTGLAGGAMAKDGELVLSLARMRRIDPIDFLGGTLRVQAGAITEAVHQHCEEYGLTWPVDFASKGSSQVGGNIATNAGGVKVIRYGLTRQWVLGLQVVTASGQVLELNGALEKNNTGLDLRQLFIGSEGTLGVITEATLKLTRLPARQSVLLFAVRDVEGVLRLFRDARRAPFTIAAYEFFTDRCLARVTRHRKVRAPFGQVHPCYVLLEVEDASDEVLESWTETLFERELIDDGTRALDSSQAAELWTLREAISESLSATGLPHKNDIALPVAKLEAFCNELEAFFLSTYPDWEICLFGHIGDGNLHLNVMKPEGLAKDAFLTRTSEADHAIFELVQRHGGSISAEHGIGLLKKPYLSYSRTPAELALFRTIKRALDPKNILNPGKVIDL